MVKSNCITRDCLHLTGVAGEEGGAEVCTCKAFPGGIPKDIDDGPNLHLEVVPGQVEDFVFTKWKPPGVRPE